MKTKRIEMYKPNYTKTEKVRKWTKVAKALVLTVIVVLSANNAEAGHHGNVWWQDKPKPRRTEERSERVVENTDWEERQRVAREDFQRRENARREREFRERVAEWESTDWTRRDYDIALKVINAHRPATARLRESYGAYTKEHYEKALVIRRVYERSHPDVRLSPMRPPEQYQGIVPTPLVSVNVAL